MQEKSKLALTLIKLRKQKRVSSQVVADAIGVKGTTYRRYEISTEPKLDVLVKLADYFGVSVDYLTGRAESAGVKNRVFVCSDGSEYVVNTTSMELDSNEVNLINSLRNMSEADVNDIYNFIEWKQASKKN